MREEEIIVAALIESAMARATMRPVESQSSGEWDYDLCIDDEQFPFEVTRFTSAKRREVYRAILGRSGKDGQIPRTLCKADWWIHPVHRADIRRIRREVDAMLAKVESLGLTEFDINGNGSEAAEVLELWSKLRIEHGIQMRWNPTGYIRIALPGDSATLSSEQVFDAAVGELSKPDNCLKLGKSSARQRHLGIFVDGYGYPAQAAMQSGYLPSRPLPLPSEVTHVWLVTWIKEPRTYRVWRYAADDGWKDFGLHNLAS